MKADKATVQARVEDIARVMLDGAMPFQIGPYVSEQERAGTPPWTLAEGAKPLSSRHIRRLVRRAEALIADAARTNRQKLLRRHLAQRRALYARAVAAGDVRAALAVLDSEAKLEGLLDQELIRELDELRRELEHLKKAHDLDDHGNDKEGARRPTAGGDGTPGQDEPGPAPPEGGPGRGADRGRDAARPVAGEPAEGGAAADASPLFPPER
jgi:hypothetical protein